MFSDNQKQMISAVLFFTSYILLLRFMLLYRDGMSQNFAIFWLLLILIFGSIVYQILRFGNQKWANFILFQQFLTLLLFITIPSMLLDGTGFRSNDVYAFLMWSEYIDTHPGFLYSGPPGLKWPLFPFLLLSASKILGVELFHIASFIPLLLGTTAVIFVYLITKELFDDNRSALLALLLVIPLFFRTAIPLATHWASLGYLFFPACIFVYLKKLRTARTATKFTVLAILFLSGTIFAHPVATAFMAAFFIAMSLQFLWPRILKWLRLSLPGISEFSFGPEILGFAALAVVAWLVHWMYISQWVFEVGVVTVAKTFGVPTLLLSPRSYTHIIEPTLRTMVIYIGDWFLIVLCGVLIIYELLIRRHCKYRDSDFMLASWVALGFLAWMILNRMATSLLDPNRVWVFVFPFMLVAASHITMQFRVKIRNLLICLLIVCMFISVYTDYSIQPENPVSQHAAPAYSGFAAQEVQAASWFHGEEKIVTESSIETLFRYKNRVTPCFTIDVFEENMKGLRLFRLLYLESEEPRFVARGKQYLEENPPLDEETLALLPSTPWLQKVYDNGKWMAYAITWEQD